MKSRTSIVCCHRPGEKPAHSLVDGAVSMAAEPSCLPLPVCRRPPWFLVDAHSSEQPLWLCTTISSLACIIRARTTHGYVNRYAQTATGPREPLQGEGRYRRPNKERRYPLLRVFLSAHEDARAALSVTPLALGVINSLTKISPDDAVVRTVLSCLHLGSKQAQLGRRIARKARGSQSRDEPDPVSAWRPSAAERICVAEAITAASPGFGQVAPASLRWRRSPARP